ncbi:hypothetical protein RESH_01116 [Rhodopirellula europaea SH398]|uniref:Uncharacterized protein n=1 Tax=Rhodopirellula europaea SH398 TaxID=1263868 RepID=M5SA08_9BACT|nr:hypothetical protein RESH_01116 [Rhodopirellula europaea SH398]
MFSGMQNRFHESPRRDSQPTTHRQLIESSLTEQQSVVSHWLRFVTAITAAKLN